MKKIIAIVLFLIFAISESGLAITFHYCKGRFYKAELYGNADGCCCKTHSKMSHNCCNSKISVLKIKTNYLSTAAVNHFPAAAFEAAVMPGIFSLDYQSDFIPVNNGFDGSPPGDQDVILLNRVLRI